MAASLTRDGDCRWRISGELDFASVPRLWAELAPQLDGRDQVLDLADVKRSNSAALALLLEAQALAGVKGGRLRVEGLPANLAQLGHVSGLSGLLAEMSA